jgi:hypothetical protein
MYIYTYIHTHTHTRACVCFVLGIVDWQIAISHAINSEQSNHNFSVIYKGLLVIIYKGLLVTQLGGIILDVVSAFI